MAVCAGGEDTTLGGGGKYGWTLACAGGDGVKLNVSVPGGGKTISGLPWDNEGLADGGGVGMPWLNVSAVTGFSGGAVPESDEGDTSI